jgi:hypothetical protein
MMNTSFGAVVEILRTAINTLNASVAQDGSINNAVIPSSTATAAPTATSFAKT